MDVEAIRRRLLPGGRGLWYGGPLRSYLRGVPVGSTVMDANGPTLGGDGEGAAFKLGALEFMREGQPGLSP